MHVDILGMVSDSVSILPIWEFPLLGNRLLDYLIALGIFLVFIIAFKWIQWLVLRYLERAVDQTKTELDDALVEVTRLIKPPFYSFVGFYIALKYLNIEGVAERAVTVILLVWLVYQVVRALQIFIEYFVKRRLSNTEDMASKSVTRLVRSLSNIVLWTLGALFVLSNLGVNVTSLIAGLGIGGIAVALAAQNILGDIFSSLAIYFDKPFVPGDFIEVGERKGTVQQIGIKTTRIKSTSGEELIVPNTELTGEVVSNFGRMTERRVSFEFGVTYDTPTEKMKRIPEMVKNIIEGQEKTRFDRVHFREFADSALNYEVVYFLKTKEYPVYLDTHQTILLAIKESFEEVGIEMAYPTSTVYMHNNA